MCETCGGPAIRCSSEEEALDALSLEWLAPLARWSVLGSGVDDDEKRASRNASVMLGMSETFFVLVMICPIEFDILS